jgi:hypothetical protein
MLLEPAGRSKVAPPKAAATGGGAGALLSPANLIAQERGAYSSGSTFTIDAP